MSRLERLFAVVLALASAFFSVRRNVERGPRSTFLVPPAVAARAELPFHPVEFVSPEGLTPVVHAPSICVGPDGGLLAAWDGGGKEGVRDVRLLVAARENRVGAAWSAPREGLSAR